MSNSPFASFANSTLKFQVAGAELVTDPKTGNVRPTTLTVEVAALLDVAKAPRTDELPGSDSTSVYLEGFAVDPMILPHYVGYRAIADAVWAGRRGRFVLGLTAPDPYGASAATGTEINGYFQSASMAYEDPTTPTPEPPVEDGRVKIPFAWGDASPKQVWLAPANTTVFTAQIVITVPFNGVGAALALGDAVVGDRLIRADQNNPAAAGEYEANPGHTYASETQILLTITPGEGASAGAGFVILEI